MGSGSFRTEARYMPSYHHLHRHHARACCSLRIAPLSPGHVASLKPGRPWSRTDSIDNQRVHRGQGAMTHGHRRVCMAAWGVSSQHAFAGVCLDVACKMLGREMRRWWHTMHDPEPTIARRDRSESTRGIERCRKTSEIRFLYAIYHFFHRHFLFDTAFMHRLRFVAAFQSRP